MIFHSVYCPSFRSELRADQRVQAKLYCGFFVSAVISVSLESFKASLFHWVVSQLQDYLELLSVWSFTSCPCFPPNFCTHELVCEQEAVSS